ncbi:MAG: ankyrin repeat domain-containing protein [Candidatus Symbiodolus clandestinus]
MIRSRVNTAESLRTGSQPPSAARKIRPSSFPSLSSIQAPKVNLAQNTELHQAVANRQFELINTIVEAQPHLISIRNKQGETAADWFLEYLNNFFHFKDPDVIKLLPEKIRAGNIELVEDYLKNNGSVKLRFPEGNTLLHLAIEHNQIEIVRLIRKHISPQLMSSLLDMDNFHGATPKELSIKLKNPEMIKLLQDLSFISIQPSIKTTSSERLVPSISKNLFINIEESTDLLTDLCCASYWILKQSLETLNKSLVTSSIEQLLTKLFSVNNIKNDIIQLEKNTQEVHTFFKQIIQEDRVHEKIILSTEKPYVGWTNKKLHLIYINLLKGKEDIAHLILTLIHEASHLIHSSYDIKYCERFENNNWIINFSDCKQLLEKNDTIINLTPERIQLLKIQYLLEGKKSSFNNWLAHHNADTFAVAVLGLAAFGWNCAEVEDSNLLINGNRFLTALSNYSYQLQPTTKPRSPDPPSETLLSPMASSDHPENPKLLGKIRRILLKATKKTPSIPRASSNASTAASSSPPQSPESNFNQKTSANSLMAGIVTMGIGKDRLPVFPPTSSTSPPDQIVATPDNLLKTGPSSPPWTA